MHYRKYMHLIRRNASRPMHFRKFLHLDANRTTLPKETYGLKPEKQTWNALALH